MYFKTDTNVNIALLQIRSTLRVLELLSLAIILFDRPTECILQKSADHQYYIIIMKVIIMH